MQRIGPFEVVRRIGAGGMAEVFEAARRGPGGFEQRVCVKRILPSLAGDPELRRLFGREARVAAALRHRSITQVIAFGEDEEGHPYLALELVEGMDLRSLMRARRARLPVPVAGLIGAEVARALAYAHAGPEGLGPVVHRDVSPANVLLGLDGAVKLTDFGISKALAESAITHSPIVRGNVFYIAPEQIEGTWSGDPRCDLYALGVGLYQCVTGKRAYAGTPEEAMRALMRGEMVPPELAAPDLSEEVCGTLSRLTARQPADRFEDATAAAVALGRWCEAGEREARDALEAFVREHHAAVRDHDAATAKPERVRARARVAAPAFEAMPIELTEPGNDPPREAESDADGGGVSERWRPYQRAPHAWAAKSDADAIRVAQGKPRPEDERGGRGAGPEQRVSEQRVPEQRVPEQRVPEQRVPGEAVQDAPPSEAPPRNPRAQAAFSISAAQRAVRAEASRGERVSPAVVVEAPVRLPMRGSTSLWVGGLALLVLGVVSCTLLWAFA